MATENPPLTWETLDQLNQGHEKPARFAVIGHPVAHSLSPALHQPALDFHNQNARYVRIDLEPGMIAQALPRFRELGLQGINVTVPHKLEALEACDQIEESARLMGAVNTLTFEDDLTLGSNTDGPGFSRAIREDFGVDLSDIRIVILGAGGGAGRAIATQCARENCQRLVLANRTLSKLEPIRDLLRPLWSENHLEGPGDRVQIFSLPDPALREAVSEAELIINTTSLGLKRLDSPPIPASWIEPHHLVYDTIYNPASTELLRQASTRGARTANGLSLLLHQGALSFQTWLALDPPLNLMRKNLKAALGKS